MISADSDLQQILTCSQEIERNTEEIANGGEDQAEAVNRTTTFVEQLSENIDSVAQNAEVAHQAAHTARESALEALDLVGELIRGMDRIGLNVEASEKKLRVLRDRSQEIGSIVETIATISARTDMLALNAAIESVRAGEQGRGFAIVAEEVRELAEQTAQATREAASLIESVQVETHESIAVMVDEHARVEAEARRANAAGEALQHISRISSEAEQHVAGITQSTQNQLRLTHEVVTAMVRISEVAKRIRSRADGACWTTKALSKLACRLNETLSPLSDGFVPNEDIGQSTSAADQEPSGQPAAAANTAAQQPSLVVIR